MNKILKLAYIDFKIIFRDPSLKSFVFLPILLFVLIVWGVTPLVERYDSLTPYLSLFLIVAVIENTQLFSFINTMVLIDEKETGVAKVYGVIPLTKPEFILSRFIFPYTLTVLLNVVLFEVQPLFDITFTAGLLMSCLAALVVPVYALTINSFASNRMQGMVYVKALNMIVLLPFAAFFVPDNLKHLFGIFPTHWLFQSMDQLTKDLPYGLFLGIGFCFLAILAWMVSRLFIRRHFV
jgi:fluoroquinolone transport system permease protein